VSSSARQAPLDLAPEAFRRLGHRLVDQIADFLAELPTRPITRGDGPDAIRALLPEGPLPEEGRPDGELLDEAVKVLFERSLFNGHPRFWGYVTSSAAPLGALGELLAAAVNSNVGAFGLSPVATEIERQAVGWIAELIGYPSDAGGILVSGGNMANFVGVLAARKARLPWDVRQIGMGPRTARIFATREAHTWLHKAADLFGFGTDAIVWVAADAEQRMDVSDLERRIAASRSAAALPFLIVASAGTVSTGAVDPLRAIADVAEREQAWLHVDGAYGGFAAAVPDAHPELHALGRADSVAIDPHKWMYVPIEAGCTLVRDRERLREAFSFRPPYYHFDEEAERSTNFFEWGPQNTRGFRALKTWLALRRAGRSGYARMIGDDIALARALHETVGTHPDLEAFTQSLSITTFRYAPRDLRRGTPEVEAYLSKLNTELLSALQAGGELYLSNAVLGERFLLRACVVNFRTEQRDIAAAPEIVVRVGRAIDARLRPSHLEGT
jgi:glutamate/tyrosine decarboxylase-like PLP-dependent enzyme